jgi:hypothetical protein
MDSMVMIMFFSVIATLTGLNFMELRKIRKHLERTDSGQEAKKSVPAMVGQAMRT